MSSDAKHVKGTQRSITEFALSKDQSSQGNKRAQSTPSPSSASSSKKLKSSTPNMKTNGTNSDATPISENKEMESGTKGALGPLVKEMKLFRAGPDPGFSIGGRGPILGGFGLERGHFSVKMYAKTKELGPVGGSALARPLDPPMV